MIVLNTIVKNYPQYDRPAKKSLSRPKSQASNKSGTKSNKSGTSGNESSKEIIPRMILNPETIQ